LEIEIAQIQNGIVIVKKWTLSLTQPYKTV